MQQDDRSDIALTIDAVSALAALLEDAERLLEALNSELAARGAPLWYEGQSFNLARRVLNRGM